MREVIGVRGYVSCLPFVVSYPIKPPASRGYVMWEWYYAVFLRSKEEFIQLVQLIFDFVGNIAE